MKLWIASLLASVTLAGAAQAATRDCISDGYEKGRTLGRSYCQYVKTLYANDYNPTPALAMQSGVCDWAATIVCKNAMADTVGWDSFCKQLWRNDQYFSYTGTSARAIYQDFMNGCNVTAPAN